MKVRLRSKPEPVEPAKSKFEEELASVGFLFHADAEPIVMGVSIEGRENTGKTSLAYSASALGPTVSFAPDPGARVVREHWKVGREIGIKRFSYTLSDGVDPTDMDAVSADLLPRVEEFRDNVSLVLAAGAKVIIGDTWTDMYDMVRTAITGKLNPTLNDDFGKAQAQVNQVMHALGRQIYQGRAHFIALHKVANRAGFGETPRWEMRGWKDIAYYADMVLRCEYDVMDPSTESVETGAEKRFLVEVLKNKDDKSSEGRRVPWKKLTGFCDLMAELVPGWRGPKGA